MSIRARSPSRCSVIGLIPGIHSDISDCRKKSRNVMIHSSSERVGHCVRVSSRSGLDDPHTNCAHCNCVRSKPPSFVSQRSCCIYTWTLSEPCSANKCPTAEGVRLLYPSPVMVACVTALWIICAWSSDKVPTTRLYSSSMEYTLRKNMFQFLRISRRTLPRSVRD
jgi:hypothetical protein